MENFLLYDLMSKMIRDIHSLKTRLSNLADEASALEEKISNSIFTSSLRSRLDSKKKHLEHISLLIKSRYEICNLLENYGISYFE